MTCCCVKNIDYVCDSCDTSNRLSRLTSLDKVKLKQYTKYLKGEIEPDAQMFELMNYLLDRDIDSDLAVLL